MEPPDYIESEKILEHENRRNKLAPKFMPHSVLKNNKITIITNRRKAHKQKIKPKRKFTGVLRTNV